MQASVNKNAGLRFLNGEVDMKLKILIGLFFIGLLACNRDNEPIIPASEQLEKDIAIIDEYLQAKGITAVKDTSGVRYVIHTLGTGPKPKLSNCIRVSYAGRLLSDDSQFDSNANYKSPLGVLISGWKIAFPLLPQGSKATLYIPSGYAYGRSGSGEKIPANSILIFEVELLDVYAYNSAGGYCYNEPLLLPEVQLAKDVAIIDQYLSSNNITAQTDASGLRYKVQLLGAGAKPTVAGNCVRIKYTGRLIDGSVFDASESYKAPLKRLIQGFQTGLAMFPKGTKVTLYIPSGLAYGPTGSGSRIPPNANLIFEVEILDVTEYNATLDYCN